jgi:glycosyltransferase involved in cell wall biosynthesis
MVILPTGKSMAKSGNRAIESIRRGRFPVCGYLPAFADLGVWVGDIADGVQWALENRREALARIGHAQAYVRKAYSPRRIAEQWLEVIQSV